MPTIAIGSSALALPLALVGAGRGRVGSEPSTLVRRKPATAAAVG